jgi:glycosyltransferase involved in cell wall biosynthesis
MIAQSLIPETSFPGRLGLQQRVVPSYRAPFFDLLAAACGGGLSVLAGEPLAVEGISTATHLEQADFRMAENLHFSDPSTKTYLCWQRDIVGWLETWDPDALILEGNPRYVSNHLALRWMKKRARPVIGWGLGAPSLTGAFSGLRHWNRNNYLQQLDGIVAYSQRGAQEYRELGIAPQRIFVATNSVMPRPDHELPQRPATLPGRPQILFVGRLQARKRLDILLHACAALPAEIQPNLVIVGDGPARAEFQSLARQIYPPAEFVGGKYGDETRPYFLQADLFVLPGTGGLAVQQAMAYGLPVIVAKGDGTQDDLVRPQNGWQVSPGDQDAFTRVLHEALSDIGRLRAMGAESYRMTYQDANLERMVEVFVEALHTVCDL